MASICQPSALAALLFMHISRLLIFVQGGDGFREDEVGGVWEASSPLVQVRSLLLVFVNAVSGYSFQFLGPDLLPKNWTKYCEMYLRTVLRLVGQHEIDGREARFARWLLYSLFCETNVFLTAFVITN